MEARYSIKEFRALTIEELYENLRLRSEVFVVEQDCVYQDLDGLDKESLHVMQYSQEKLVGYTRLLPKGLDFDDACAIGRVVTSPKERRKGLGRPLMRKSLSECSSRWPGVPVKLHAQTYLLEFYREFGFDTYGDEFLEDGIPHYFMVKY